MILSFHIQLWWDIKFHNINVATVKNFVCSRGARSVVPYFLLYFYSMHGALFEKPIKKKGAKRSRPSKKFIISTYFNRITFTDKL